MIKMFPYTVPNLIIAWTMLFFFVNDTASGKVIDTVIFIIFILIAKKYYGKKPKTIWDRSSAIAFNLAILPLLIVNIMTFPYFISGQSIGASGMIYLLPMIYSPPIYVISVLVIYGVSIYLNRSRLRK